ncbi:MAG: hypothetical protein IPK82_09855 [Polyangiaceae bacterium]|nr:hypothetical protein [Polyangiaceae bacterium]
MVSVTKKSRMSIQGFEFDWLGVDEVGCVALFSTAGAGYVPEPVFTDTQALEGAIDAVLALPKSTEATFAPIIRADLINTWQLVAERGLYAYDCDPNGGPYELVAAPTVPSRIEQLPPAVASVAGSVRCGFRFEANPIVKSGMLPP